MEDERAIIRNLFEDLLAAPYVPFPKPRERLQAPSERGVYIIYGPGNSVLHVGRTPRAKQGIHQRLTAHLNAGSSFVNQYYKGQSHLLREAHGFRCLVLPNDRKRALLEAYAAGCLCPKYIGAAPDDDF